MDLLTSRSSLPALQYSALQPGTKSFRLIRLLAPGPVSTIPFSKYPRVEIIDANVDDVGRYDALSYAWSHFVKSRSNCRVVVVTKDGDRELPINASLEAALLTLSESRSNGRPLFIDQISINQADNEEKSKQVRYMGEIYTNSVLTIVWLGPQTLESSAYFDFARDIGTEGILSRVMGPNVRNFPVVFKAIMDPKVEVDAAQAEDRDDILDLISRYGAAYPVRGLRDVLQRTWFNRLWVIQEICLASSVVFFCGDRTVCFDCFRGGILFFTIWNTHWMRNVKTSTSAAEVLLRNQIFDLNRPFLRIFQERKLLSTGVKSSLYQLVIKYNVNHGGTKVGATLGEDRIFGLLGIAEDDALKRAVAVRYGDVHSVYIRFATEAVKQNLDILLFSQFPKSVSGLPSWVPDWAMSQMNVPYGYSDLRTAVFSASGSKNENEQQLCIDSATGILGVQGFLVDRIVRVGDDNSAMHQPPEQDVVVDSLDYVAVQKLFVQIDQYLDAASQIASCPFLYSSDPEERTLCAIRLSDGGLTSKALSKSLPAEEVAPLMQRMHRNMSHWGQRLMDTRRVVESYRLGSIVQTIGVVPWYWIPASEVDTLRLCAVRPLEAGEIFVQGVWRFMIDVLSLIVASLIVQSFAQFLRFRRSFAKFDFNAANREEVLKKVGLEGDLIHSSEWEAYTSNVLKTASRRLFLTEHGYLGLGPMLLQENDLVSVVFGMTTPVILRPAEKVVNTPERTRTTSGHHVDGEAPLRCSYVGEAYCDGIMDGEMCELTEARGVTTFEIS